MVCLFKRFWVYWFVMLKFIVLVKFCFKGFVVILMFLVWCNLGCFGVLECNCLKCFKSFKFKLKFYKCNKLYVNAFVCLLLKISLFLLSYLGLVGLRFRCKFKIIIILVNFKYMFGCLLLVLFIMFVYKKWSVLVMFFNCFKLVLFNCIKFFYFWGFWKLF